MALSKLKLYRLQRGLKQSNVAKGIGISKGYLSGLENKSVPITEDILNRLARYYGVAIKELI